MHTKIHPKRQLKVLLSIVEEVIKKAVCKELGLAVSADQGSLNIGYTLPAGVIEAIKKITVWWVEQIDRLLDQNANDLKLYAYLMSIRGMTYPELLLFWDPAVDESEFRYHRVFSFLMIVDEPQRRAFKHCLSKMQEDPFAVYLYLLYTHKVPVTSFFLRTKIPLYFPLSAIRKHIYLVSQSGAGKSELLKLLIYDLIRRSGKKRRYTTILLDPHHDLSHEVLGFSFFRKLYKDRLIYINPTINKEIGVKEAYSPTINLFEIPDKEEDTIDAFSQEITNAISEMIKKPSNADEAFSTNMDAFLKPCIATLLRMDRTTDLRDLKRFMDDEANEDLIAIGQRSPDEEHRSFFQNSFSKKRYNTTKDAVYIKLQSLLNSALFRRLTVGESTINLPKAVNNGSVIIFDFSKARGRKAAADFGRFMVAYIQAIALRRQDTPKRFRKQTFLFIDEFHNYVGNSIKEIMAEARKFSLSLVLAHQVVGQEMSTSLMDIILSNANLKVVGKNARKSLEAMGANIDIPLEKLKRIPKYEFYVHNKDKDYPALLMKSPDFLVNKPHQYNQFYMSEAEKKKLLEYFVYESGYYKKIKRPLLPDLMEDGVPTQPKGPIDKTGRGNSVVQQGPITPAHDL